MNTETKKRAWVKNATIIFLSVLLVLTFFSNTILNWSLPEVSGQYSGYGQIKTGITGSGTVKSNMVYSITQKDDREVKEVLVKKGDHVEAGDTIILLEDYEDSELVSAEKSLSDMEYNYEVKLINHNNSDSRTEAEEIRTELAETREELKTAQSLDRQIVGAEEIVKIYETDSKRYQNSVNDLEQQVTDLTNGEAASSPELAAKIAEYDEAVLNLAEAKTALAAATSEYDEIANESDTTYSTAKAAYEAAKKTYDSAEQELEYLKEDYQRAIADSSRYNSTQSSLAAASATLTEAKAAQTKAATTLDNAKTALKKLHSGNIDSQSEYTALKTKQTETKAAYDAALAAGDTTLAAQKKAELDTLTATLSAWDEYTAANIAYEKATAAVTTAQKNYDSISSSAGGISGSTDKELASMKRNIDQKETELDELAKELKEAWTEYETESSRDVRLQAAKEKKTAAQKSVNEWERKEGILKNETDKMLSAETKSVKAELKEEQKRLSSVKEKLESAQDKLDDLKSEMTKSPEELEASVKSLQKQLTTLTTTGSKDDALFELEIARDLEEIESQREKVEKLKAKSYAGEVVSKVTGTITSLNCVAGQTVTAGTSFADIEVDGRGYTIEISVTAEQAATVHEGDRCTITDYYWGPEVKLTVGAIKQDTSNPGKGKIIEINVDGEVTEGQNFNLLIGERQTSYDLVVPNSAVREDSNGKYILIASVKSMPLGNRYIAKRVDVTVLKKDTVNSAVDAGTDYGYEYVITSSTAPIEDGSQVRLAEK